MNEFQHALSILHYLLPFLKDQSLSILPLIQCAEEQMNSASDLPTLLSTDMLVQRLQPPCPLQWNSITFPSDSRKLVTCIESLSIFYLLVYNQISLNKQLLLKHTDDTDSIDRVYDELLHFRSLSQMVRLVTESHLQMSSIYVLLFQQFMRFLCAVTPSCKIDNMFGNMPSTHHDQRNCF